MIPQKMKRMASEALRLAMWESGSAKAIRAVAEVKELFGKFDDLAADRHIPKADITDYFLVHHAITAADTLNIRRLYEI